MSDGYCRTMENDMGRLYGYLNGEDTHNRQYDSCNAGDYIAEKERFLARYPYLKSFQDEIDHLLSTTIDPVTRLEILCILITAKLSDMRDVFKEVMLLVDKVKSVQGIE